MVHLHYSKNSSFHQGFHVLIENAVRFPENDVAIPLTLLDERAFKEQKKITRPLHQKLRDNAAETVGWRRTPRQAAPIEFAGSFRGFAYPTHPLRNEKPTHALYHQSLSVLRA